jgi:hypothetical protein
MSIWTRLYLYCIDGVWPTPKATDPTGAAEPAAAAERPRD